MFRDKYKLDNQSISPNEKLLKNLACKMTEEIENHNETVNKKRYKQPVMAFAMMAISIILVIGIIQISKSQGFKNTSTEDGCEKEYKSTGIMGINPNVQNDETTNINSDNSPDKSLVNNFFIDQAANIESIKPEWTPNYQVETVTALPIYRYLDVDIEETTKELTADLKALMRKDTTYDTLVNSNGSYSITAKDIDSDSINIPLSKYKEMTQSFINNYKSILDISNENTQYIVDPDAKSCAAVFIFNNSKSSPAEAILGYKEFISIKFFKSGDIMQLYNFKTQKEVIGEYKLLDKNSAIQYYNDGNSYSNNNFQSSPFSTNNSIRLEYMTDINQSILQPVYIINEKSNESDQNISVVPAINGKVVTSNNVNSLDIIK